ncbi:MAG TPA: DNA-processing protein DprA [Candidatus Magasanikbacteria bacterium]|nr:DNA-processing protein DprA [Candidatus Magasanikbacteria bacterium]
MAVFGNAEAVWQAEFDEFKPIGWDNTLIGEFLTWRDHVDVNLIKGELEKNQVSAVSINDPTYPENLRTIFDPPLAIFVRGHLEKSENPIAVVGSRRFTTYGQQVTDQIVRDLAPHGVDIISGLAYGIDALAHESALRYHARTYAVLGSGVDTASVFPTRNRRLADQIIESGGALISEYPPGVEPTKFSFPLRNRIIAGLSRAVVVIEAAADSGSLITANYALDNAREVFAVPGNMFSPASVGTNNLLKNGAHVCTTAEDIIETLSIAKITGPKQLSLSVSTSKDPTDTEILTRLSQLPKNIDVLIKETGLPAAKISTRLTILELNNTVRNLGGMNYILVK